MTETHETAWTIEPLDVERDLDEVLAIEQISFTSPWTREMYLWEVQNRAISTVLVLRINQRVAAICCFWVLFDDLHINNLAVHPDFRRQGVGRRLLEAGLDAGRARGAKQATLEVRASNAAALRLYRAARFEVRGVRQGYYTNPEEDALILWCHHLDRRVRTPVDA